MSNLEDTDDKPADRWVLVEGFNWYLGDVSRHAIPLGLNQMQTWLGAWAYELWYLGDKDDVQNRLSPSYGDCFTRLMRGVGWVRFSCYGLHITAWYWSLENWDGP